MVAKKKENNGKIVSLFRYPERKKASISESELLLKAEHGIVGDCHADGGERQISLLTMEEKEWMDKQEIKGFCFKKYKENVLLEGISLRNAKAGDSILCGDAELEFTETIKSCYPELCKFAEAGTCILAGSARFAKVKKEGVLQIGMDVFFCEKGGELECD